MPFVAVGVLLPSESALPYPINHMCFTCVTVHSLVDKTKEAKYKGLQRQPAKLSQNIKPLKENTLYSTINVS